MRRYLIGDGTCAPRIPRAVAALLAALQIKGATSEGLLELEEHEWEPLLAFCDPAHLTLPLAQAAVASLPAWVVKRLRTNLADNAQRFERVKATYREAAVALDKAGVEFLVLKGFTQSPGYVADARLRMQSDLDLYCPKETIVRAREVLIGIGYQSEQNLDYSRADHLPAMVRPRDWQWRGNAFDPEMPLSIELHFCLWNEAVLGFPVHEVDSFWQRRVRRSLGELRFNDLHPVDHLGYFALHILRCLLQGEWIVHHVLEMATFLHDHANDDAFWRSWREMHSASFRDLQAIAFFHARCWFCCDAHADVVNQVASLPPIHRKWLERFAGASLENMFQKNKDRAWLHASLVKPARGRRQLIWETIMPAQVWRIRPIGNPAAAIRNRQPAESVSSSKYGRYAAYIFDRSTDHVRSFLVALLHGISFWLSLRWSGKEFNQ